METSWTFFFGGKFINVDRLEGETKKRFSMRVSFILNGLNKLSLFELLKYSKLYTDLVLLGLQPSSDHREKINWLLGIEKTKPRESPEVNEVAFEDVRNVMTGDNIINVNSGFIETETGTTFTVIGDEAFINIPENNRIVIVDQPISNVTLKTSSEEGNTAGAVLEIAVKHDENIEIIELKTCADSTCEEPAPILVTHPELGLNVIVNPIVIEAPTYNEDEEVFGDPNAKNAFMIPDMECYNKTVGDDPEASMKACVLKRFASDYILKMKLRSTRNRILRFVSTIDNSDLDYWTLDNRYGVILMEVRESLAPGKVNEKHTVQDLKIIVGKFLDLPMDSGTMTTYRNNVLNSVEIKDGLIVDYSELKLLDIFKAYDVEMFEGVLTGLIKLNIFTIIFKWTEDDISCGLDVGEENIFTLEPSKKIFQALPKNGVVHKIFGIPCDNPGNCLLIFMETFIITILHTICNFEDSIETLAEHIFGHTDTEIKFTSNNDSKEITAKYIQEKLKSVQNKSLAEDISITIKDLGKVLLMNARRAEGVTISTFPGDNNPQIKDDQRLQPYLSVTHIRDVPIS